MNAETVADVVRSNPKLAGLLFSAFMLFNAAAGNAAAAGISSGTCGP